MSNQPVVTVVIPTYNRSASILTSINSVFEQTFSDWELVVVDDGSTDDTQNRVASISDSRMRYIKQVNGGGSKARNVGIDAARGRYVAFLDSDDVLLPHHLENALIQLALNINFCFYTQVVVERDDETTFLKPPRAIGMKEHISDYLLRDRGFIQTSTIVVPRELAKLTRFDENLSFGQDTDFAIRLANNGGEFVMGATPGAIWNDRYDPKRLSANRRPEQRSAWLQSVKSIITKKALMGDYGWHVAKGYFVTGRRLKALALFTRAAVLGCYKPKLAVVVFLQVVLSKSAYRKLSDLLLKIGAQP
ncbi:MAG: glycosyltransferase [Sideroxydans sp.]|nr:glycosyltransferase [Sideroxydans sp.]